MEEQQKLLKIGIFYDGNFFFHVSNYYRYSHPKNSYISIPGLHEFIRHEVARVEKVDIRYTRIVDAHFFRGRLSAKEADARQTLYNERVFDDILMRESVITHYLPLRNNEEKGIDVWLALEAFEQTIHKHFNVLILIAGDADFIPLARKVNSLGTRVMVLGWDFEYTDDIGRERKTITSLRLLEEVTYPVMMHTIIDENSRKEDAHVTSLFMGASHVGRHENPEFITGGPDEGVILALKEGYGFIKSERYPANVFFHWSKLTNCEFQDLCEGDRVKFCSSQGDRGPIADEVELIADQEPE